MLFGGSTENTSRDMGKRNREEKASNKEQASSHCE